ncbi:MAG: hydroxyacid dehydrogenase, partial [Candidatus Wildermuthbacteria bacterium]|nr:hydroxyacid dehydrogenase [Candidatus Wildermuthbacteria bacterium]
MEKFPNLKLIATRSTGYDHIDINECKKRGVAVASVPGYGENTVAEFTFALILGLSKKIFEGYHRIKEQGKFDLTGLQGFDLKGKTLGVIGTGRIGKHVIKIAKGMDMNVVAFDVMEDKETAQKLGFQYLALDELLGQSDIITLHVPYMKETHYLVNKNNIRRIKKGAYIINTSRGGIIETEALVAALRDG